jgi:hypothetical protein
VREAHTRACLGSSPRLRLYIRDIQVRSFVFCSFHPSRLEYALLTLQVPGGAIIFLQNTGLILEPPSASQISFARLSEAERLHLTSRDQKVLEERAKAKQAEASEAVDDADQSSGSAVLNEEGEQKFIKEASRLKRKRGKVSF